MLDWDQQDAVRDSLRVVMGVLVLAERSCFVYANLVSIPNKTDVRKAMFLAVANCCRFSSNWLDDDDRTEAA